MIDRAEHKIVLKTDLEERLGAPSPETLASRKMVEEVSPIVTLAKKYPAKLADAEHPSRLLAAKDRIGNREEPASAPLEGHGQALYHAAGEMHYGTQASGRPVREISGAPLSTSGCPDKEEKSAAAGATDGEHTNYIVFGAIGNCGKDSDAPAQGVNAQKSDTTVSGGLASGDAWPLFAKDKPNERAKDQLQDAPIEQSNKWLKYFKFLFNDPLGLVDSERESFLVWRSMSRVEKNDWGRNYLFE